MHRRTLGFGFVCLASVFYLAPYTILAIANDGDRALWQVQVMVDERGTLIHLHGLAALAGVLALRYLLPDEIASVKRGVKRWWQRRKAKLGKPKS